MPEFGSQEAVIALTKEGQRVVLFAELAATVKETAGGLLHQGLDGNSIIALCAANSPEWVATALAVIHAGCILLPIDPQADKETLKHIFTDSGAVLLFTDSDMEKKFQGFAHAGLQEIYFIDKDEGEKSWRRFADMPAGNARQIDPGEVAALFYTSGTTGPPKGVPLTHANLICQPAAIMEAGIITEDDKVFLPLPLHHVYPFVIGMLTPLVLGVPVIFPYSFTGREIIRGIAEGRATIIIGVPRLYRTLYEGIRNRVIQRGSGARFLFAATLAVSMMLRNRFGILAGRKLFSFIHKQFGSTLRILASGGSALDADLALRLEGLGWKVAIGYGITETSPLLTMHRPGEGKLYSVGRAVRGVELKIDTEVGTSQKWDSAGTEPKTGEVLARGPNVFHGYHNLPEKTKKAFTEDGWFRTGDLGRLDTSGFLYLLGRANTLIITESGKNIQPDEIEEIYENHPAISEIGIFGNQGRLAGIIVPDLKNVDPDAENLENVIRQAVDRQSAGLPSYKRLTEYVISHESLARTRLGKIRRHLLAEMYFQVKTGEKSKTEQSGPIEVSKMSPRDQALLEDKNARRVWKILSGRYPERRLTPDSSPLFDLGIDSLEWLDISLEIQQQTRVELSEEIIGRIGTVRDLLEEVVSLPETGKSMDPERPLREPETVLDDEQKRWLAEKGKVLSILSYIFYQVNRLVMKSWFRLEVYGRENLPEKGPYLITPNHLSLLDPFVLAAALPYDSLRMSFFAGWRMIAFKNAFFRFISRLAQAVPIDSRHAVSSSIAFSSAVLQRGKNLILFPEGERSADGRLKEFKIGVSLLLEHYDIPVVPVFIKGTYEALPKGGKFPYPRKVTVTFGTPLRKKQLLAGVAAESTRDRIRHRLREEVARLDRRRD